MPAGGTWIVQNKRRPGAYINFFSVPRAIGSMGTRGTVAIALPMAWGPEGTLIKLHKDDLLNGKSVAKVGCDAFDTEASLPYRLALSGASVALLYRTNTTGGSKATAEIEEDKLDVTAKYKGDCGNNITVVIKENPAKTENDFVDILYNGLLKEEFEVAHSSITSLNDIESKFVDFDIKEETGGVPHTAGVNLQGGTNGTLNTNYSEFFSLLDTEDFQCMAIEDTTTAAATLASNIKAKLSVWREDRGKKVQAVVYNYPNADYEGIISVNQGFKTLDETVTEALFPIWVASHTAGSQVFESLTCKVVEGAVEIINWVPEEDIVDALTAGRFILSYRQDGAVCVEQDINTLREFTVDKNDAFSKNRVIRCLDEIGNTVALIFNRNYCGKVDNDNAGRNMFKTEIISLIDQLQGIGAVQNFDGAKDITVLPGDRIDAVVVDLVIQPVDSMEKLYMTVQVNA